MGWKDWSYWLRGGVIGLVLEIIFFGVFFFNKCNNTEMVWTSNCSWNISNFIENLSNLFNEVLIVKLIAVVILLLGFIIGSLIGFLYGKIKNRKQEVGK